MSFERYDTPEYWAWVDRINEAIRQRNIAIALARTNRDCGCGNSCLQQLEEKRLAHDPH